MYVCVSFSLRSRSVSVEHAGSQPGLNRVGRRPSQIPGGLPAPAQPFSAHDEGAHPRPPCSRRGADGGSRLGRGMAPHRMGRLHGTGPGGGGDLRPELCRPRASPGRSWSRLGRSLGVMRGSCGVRSALRSGWVG